MSIETMKLALEALEQSLEYWNSKGWRYKNRRPNWVTSANEAITALRQAIERAEKPEPVAIDWGAVHEKLIEVWNREMSADEGLDEIQGLIDTSPPPRQPLTDEQRKGITAMWSKGHRNYTVGDIIDAVEAAHGIGEKK